MQKYYEEQNVESCFNSILDLKQQSKTVMAHNLFITTKQIAKHFHTHDVKIPQNILSRFISSIRPKKKVKRIKKSTQRENQSNIASN
ncbi:MAG: hypothetical protein Fur0028_08660 [Bacteroidales bacterium]